MTTEKDYHKGELRATPVTPSNHSDEAESFADSLDAEMTDMGWMYQFQQVREAYLAGLAAAHAKQHATTREALIDMLNSAQHAPMYTHQSDGDCLECPVPLYTLSPEEIADALLALDGPLLDAGEVYDEAVAMCCQMVGVPNVNWPNPYREARP